MKHLIQDILKGKNLKSNLEKYKTVSVSAFGEYAALELTFSAYTMIQEIMEEKQELAGKEEQAVNDILQALEALGRGSANVSEILSGMKKLRQKITEKMDVFTCYTDRLLIYEYVLNRIELRYVSEEELNKMLAAYDENIYMQQLMAFLFSDKDKSVILDKLQFVIGQVPVRMTKNKFVQRISETMTLYKDNDAGALENFIYMIRTAAMVYEPAGNAGEYPEFASKLQSLALADYTDMDKETYHELTGLLDDAAQQIREITDFYYSLQKVVNGIYAMCILYPYQERESGLLKTCRSVWSGLAEREYRDEMLEPLEGRIEDLLDKTGYLETVIMEIKNSYQEELETFGMTDFFAGLVMVANLLSDSLFVDLEQAAKEEKADAAYVQKRTEELLAELMQKLSEVPRPVKRAIMGKVLEKLPLAFEKTEEIEEYIRVNLMGCQDKAEKCVVMTLINDMMSFGM